MARVPRRCQARRRPRVSTERSNRRARRGRRFGERLPLRRRGDASSAAAQTGRTGYIPGYVRVWLRHREDARRGRGVLHGEERTGGRAVRRRLAGGERGRRRGRRVRRRRGCRLLRESLRRGVQADGCGKDVHHDEGRPVRARVEAVRGERGAIVRQVVRGFAPPVWRLRRPLRGRRGGDRVRIPRRAQRGHRAEGVPGELPRG
mmetsp:Transcript_4842/g.22159  ORF Transcript_4842/g.22159 Transcript_4842/m.22159 type:complete len:204 (+) Transcript_4842:2269-2880(+)